MFNMNFKLILPFFWSTLQLHYNGMANQNVQVGCVNQTFCLVIDECVIFYWMDWQMVLYTNKIRTGGIIFLRYTIWHYCMKNDCVSILGKSSSYWRTCYRYQPGNLKSNEKKKNKCRFSAMGCTICGEPICDVCWDKRYLKHSNNDTAYILLYKLSIIWPIALLLSCCSIQHHILAKIGV